MIRILVISLLLLSACSHSKKSSTMITNEIAFDLQGHRGCRGLMPENTIPAMLKALELGVTTLEMDASITYDQKVILSHEPFFNHEISTTPDGKPVPEAEERSLNMYKMTYAEVLRYDVGLQTHPRFPEQQKMKAVKPLLSDVITAVRKWCSENNKPLPFFNIETKCLPVGDNIYHPAPEKFVDLLVEVLKKGQIENKTIIQSFDFRTLQYAHKAYPKIMLAALVEPDDKGTLNDHIDQLGFVPAIYSPAYERVDAALVADCHKKGMRIIPWTINETAVATSIKALGVDGMITDYPDRIK
jgi:glycerophosphoryl diester phosphodiesterase